MKIGEIIIIEAITDTITETDQEADGTIIGQVIGVTITRLTTDKVIIDQIMDKMLNAHLDIEVKVEMELEITIMTIREVEVGIEIMTGPFSQDKVSVSHGRDKSRSRSNSRVSNNRDHVQGVIDAENTITLPQNASECPNILTDEEPDFDDADPASLHMMTQDYYPIDSE